MLKLGGKDFPNRSVTALSGEVPLCECYSSAGKGILTVRSQGISQSRTTQQTSYKRFMQRNTREWLPLLGQEATTEQEAGFIYGLGAELSRVGLMGFRAKPRDW